MTIALKGVSIALILLSLNATLFAQKNKEAEQEKYKNEALDARRKEDLSFAQAARGSFNKGSWIGARYADLIAQWGEPARSYPDGNGGIVVVFENRYSHNYGSYTPGYIITNGLGQVVERKNPVDTRGSYTLGGETKIYVDKNNIITKID